MGHSIWCYSPESPVPSPISQVPAGGHQIVTHASLFALKWAWVAGVGQGCPGGLARLDGSQGEGGVPIQPCHLIFPLFFSACPDLGLRAAHPGRKGQMRLPCASRAPFAPGSNPQSRSRPLLAAVSRRNGPPGGLQPTPQPQIGSRGRTVSTSQRAERGTARAGLVWRWCAWAPCAAF